MENIGAWLTYSFAVVSFVISIWGVSICRSLQQNTANSALNSLIAIASWLVLFAPFAFLAFWILFSGIQKLRRSLMLRRSPAVELLPPEGPRSQRATTSSELGSLDDFTVKRMGELGNRCAKVVGAAAGILLVVSGTVGFIEAWKYTHSTVGPSTVHYEMAAFRLIGAFLVGCGLAIIGGWVILRSTFRKETGMWLIPLKLFASIVGMRIVQEGSQPKK
jgi:hypothetical protein